jgi:hypothetical protein
MKPLDYHFIKYNLSNGPRWIGVAWSNDGTALISTTDCNSYTEAKNELKHECSKVYCELAWFQGEYEVGINGIVPIGNTDWW